jgi:hypothetical protein
MGGLSPVITWSCGSITSFTKLREIAVTLHSKFKDDLVSGYLSQ